MLIELVNVLGQGKNNFVSHNDNSIFYFDFQWMILKFQNVPEGCFKQLIVIIII